MPLLDFQTALGRLVRVPAGGDPLRGLDLDLRERSHLAVLADSAGFRFTMDVQRSWCIGRAAKAARLTLSMLPMEERERLLNEWVDAGRGTTSFFVAEADVFFDFIAEHLPEPSHLLTICRLEQGTLRASEGAHHFKTPDLVRLAGADCVLRQGRHATLVRFYSEPRILFAGLTGEKTLPPISPVPMQMLFGPGVTGLFREAQPNELALWERLARPVPLTALLREGHGREVIEELFLTGIAECLE
ncbi:MAG TPA: hypothetical protein VH325_18270 [Bryobacteraceae bacterium]|nr:hypothetical protein [Bryobacteraceae bacterium]